MTPSFLLKDSLGKQSKLGLQVLADGATEARNERENYPGMSSGAHSPAPVFPEYLFFCRLKNVWNGARVQRPVV